MHSRAREKKNMYILQERADEGGGKKSKKRRRTLIDARRFVRRYSKKSFTVQPSASARSGRMVISG